MTDADKVGLYREVRLAMAELYKDEELYFGPVAVDIINEKESKELNEEQNEFKKNLKKFDKIF